MNQTSLIEDFILVPIPVWWQNPWLWLGVLVGVAVVFAGVAYWWRRRRPVPPPELVTHSGPLPGEEALRRLSLLKARLPEMRDYPLSIEVSEILRGFIAGQHSLPIEYQTSREFLEAAAHQTTIEPAQRKDLTRFLGFCDRVKFARQSASEKEMGEAVDDAIRYVQSTLQGTASGGRS